MSPRDSGAAGLRHYEEHESSMTDPTSPFDEPTSLALIADARRKVPEAWRKIHQLYGPLVYAWCREWRVPEQDAVDLVQDVFRNVIRRLDSFQHETDEDSAGKSRGSFRAWIWTITRNKVRDYWRVNPRRPVAVGGTDMQQHMMQIPEWEMDSAGQVAQVSELAKQVLRLIQTEFEERTWTAFWRVVVDGQSIYTVANDLEMSEGAVRQAKYRVLRRVREELQDVA